MFISSLTNPYYIYVAQHLRVCVSRCIPETGKQASSFYLILRRQLPIVLLCKVFKGGGGGVRYVWIDVA